MKTYLFSVRPHYARLIVEGIKTMELRTVVPNEDEPYEMVVYCTKSQAKPFFKRIPSDEVGFWKKRIGKVIGKATVFDKKEIILPNGGFPIWRACVRAYVSQRELIEYADGKDTVYGLCLKDAEIFDEPKELAEYNVFCKENKHILSKPPQSWCRVEEIK